jgi:hypothetical protein
MIVCGFECITSYGGWLDQGGLPGKEARKRSRVLYMGVFVVGSILDLPNGATAELKPAYPWMLV